MRVGEYLYSDTSQDVPWNPLSLAINLATGHLEWTGAATGGAVTLVVGTAAGVAGSVWAWRAGCAKCRQLAGKASQRKRIRREAVDSQARYMATARSWPTCGGMR